MPRVVPGNSQSVAAFPSDGHSDAVRTDSPRSAALLSSTPGGTAVFLAAGAWPAQPQELRTYLPRVPICPTDQQAGDLSIRRAEVPSDAEPSASGSASRRRASGKRK
uniref:Uncharacterized protein n=1 Tax=Rangifer tarandus platyrhynchus TaxID=3082113 RepID=A0ACB0F5C9_RANTA|nr:unnamed protein product [Rangifer tarandus platyrhynchus]